MMIDLTASDDVESSPKPEYRKELSTTSPIHTTIPHGGIWGGGGVRGSTIQKPGICGLTAGPIGNKFCTCNAGESGNGHMLNILARG